MAHVASDTPRPMKIRSHLFILTVGTLLPLFAFAAITAIVLAQRERDNLSAWRDGAHARPDHRRRRGVEQPDHDARCARYVAASRRRESAGLS